MGPPKYGIYIIQGEISLVVTAMRRTTRWTTHSHQVRIWHLLSVLFHLNVNQYSFACYWKYFYQFKLTTVISRLKKKTTNKTMVIKK